LARARVPSAEADSVLYAPFPGTSVPGFHIPPLPGCIEIVCTTLSRFVCITLSRVGKQFKHADLTSLPLLAIR